jgi:photosystem I subunit 9
MNKDLAKFLTSAPVIGVFWIWLTAGILIEVNRFLPDLLFHP